jgi:hypothetical protein
MDKKAKIGLRLCKRRAKKANEGDGEIISLPFFIPRQVKYNKEREGVKRMN